MNIIDVCDELSQNFIDFAYEANSERAFPDARDGLKPGQRACLWEMYSKGYTSKKPHVKSAKISGGTIASWWPHGDVAIYETFARMSQSWINNLPEVDWHGSNGNIVIGSAPASSRYTEARLSKVVEDGMLQGLKKNNVPMQLNFSEDAEWPTVLPAVLPRLLINGSQGIGVTIANTWIPMNFVEVSDVIKNYITTGEVDTTKPLIDFPSKGIIINSKDLHIIHETGKGKVVLRGRAEVTDKSILITELPYQVYVEPFIESVRKLIETDEIKGIKNIYNKTDKKHLLIEIECDNPNGILKGLYNKTDLQKSYSANQWALVGKTPQLLTLKDYIQIYVEHNLECIRREIQFDLDKAEARMHIVDGLLKALEDIDNIIKLIKTSASAAAAKDALMNTYKFTEVQAKAILDMKLAKLANLEKVELQDERDNLYKDIERFQSILKWENKQKEILIERLDALVKKYGYARRTELTHIDIKPSEKEIAEVIPEDCVVVMTQAGNIKRVPKNSFKAQRRNGKGVKTQDDILLGVISTNTVDTLMLFTNKGKMYRLVVDNVPVGTNAGKGVGIGSLIPIDADETVIAVTSLYRKTNAKYVVFITKNGLIKKTALEEYTSTKRTTGIIAIKIKEGDSIANVTFLDTEDLFLVTKQGIGIHFSTVDIAAIGRNTSGVKGIKLGEGDEVVVGLPLHSNEDTLAIFSNKGTGKRMKLTEIPKQGRGGKGVKISEDTIGGAAMVDDTDTVLVIGRPNSICISAKDMPILSRTAVGNAIIKASQIAFVAKF